MFQAGSALALRAFLPAKDFAASKRFYLELGFVMEFETGLVALLRLSDHSFLLQNFHVEEWAANCMMQLTPPISKAGGAGSIARAWCCVMACGRPSHRVSRPGA